ncbi:MAG: ABC transporter permease [Bacteroidota bacterium]
MLKNYLLLTLRNLRRRRLYALINLMGLTFGLGSMLLVILYVDYESSYDHHFDRSEDIYRLEHHFRTSWYSTLGFNNYFSATISDQWAYPLALEELAEVEVAAQVIQMDNLYLEVGEKRFVENRLLLTITGRRLLDLFSFEWLEGNPEAAFGQPNQVILTEELARKYFGTANAVGEIIGYDSLQLQVSGVIANLPPNSHFHPSMIIQLKQLPHWGAHTYLRLQPSANPEKVATQIVPPSERYQTSGLFKGLRLTPLHDLHFAEPTKYDFEWPGDPQYLYIFLWIGSLILLITITNYINLSVAFYSHRNREIGIRKVAGAQRGQIAFQFLFEAWLLTLLSLPLALGLLELLIPRFNELMGVELWTGRLWQLKPLSIMTLV